MAEPIYISANDPIPDNPRAVVVHVHPNIAGVEQSMRLGGDDINEFHVLKMDADALIMKLTGTENGPQVYVRGYNEAG